jgi:hypothetical protein
MIPVYVSRESFSKNPSIVLSQVSLESLFLNFRNSPISALKNPTDAFYQKVGKFETPILKTIIN